MRVLNGHTDTVWKLIVNRNGQLISGSYDKSIKVWNTEDGTIFKTLNGHSDHVTSLALLKDGSLVSGSWDGTIKIWTYF